MILVSVLIVVGAYLLGSIPTAVIVSRLRGGVDIRSLGDGNMGARNTYRTLGLAAGLSVALADGCKGALAVLAARWLGLTPGWQMVAGVAAVVGHDFPIFARFRGGQGLATILGAFLALFPSQAMLGLIVYGLLYLITRMSDLSAGIGCGLIFALHLFQQHWGWAALTGLLFLTIPLMKWRVSWLQARDRSCNDESNGQQKAAP